MKPFGCAVGLGPCTAWIELTGELDLAATPVLRWRLRAALAHAMLVILDLRQLSFIDAAGLHVICDASEFADAESRRLMLLRGPAQVDKVFTLTGLSEKLYMVDVAGRDGNLAPTRAPIRARSLAWSGAPRPRPFDRAVAMRDAGKESTPQSPKRLQVAATRQQIPKDMESLR